MGLFSVQHNFSELMQRIFKYTNIQNTSLPPAKELNTSIQNTFLRHHTQELQTTDGVVIWPTLNTMSHGRLYFTTTVIFN